jgi:uncharacterized protein (TIGR03118 family)
MKTLLSIPVTALLALSVSSVANAQHYTEIKLVSNQSGVAAATDSHLINPWGLSRASGSPWWISDNGTGFSTLYTGAGGIVGLNVSIPISNPAGPFKTGTPTGTIANSSPTDFLLAPGKPAAFLFSTIDGTISGWNPTVGVAMGAAPPSVTAVIVVKTTDGSVFTGLTSAKINGKTFLYTANFGKGRVDVYDNAFHKVRLPSIRDDNRNGDGKGDNDRGRGDGDGDNDHDAPFTDDRLPRNYVPFNVQAIGNDIVVTYALHEAGNPIETDGPGLGRVDIYSSTGRLLRTLEHGSWLNAPWGVALAPLDFGVFSHTLLIGQFAGGGFSENSGTIAAYDLNTGEFLGQMKDASGAKLSVNGLWAISPGNGSSPNNFDPAGAPGSELYFTAGPNQGSGGLFGYLKPVATELTQGNDQ